MKKKIILFLILTLMVSVSSLFNITALATNDNEISVSMAALTVERKWGKPGALVDLDLNLLDNPGILGATITISWDDNLVLIAESCGEAFNYLTYTSPNQYVSEGTNFVWFSNEVGEVVDGAILTLTFQVSDDAHNNEILPITVSYTLGDIVDKNENDVLLNVSNGSVRVITYQPGDVTGDECLNTHDLVSLSQYISDGCTTNPEGYNSQVFLDACDVNGDGKVNVRDLIRLSQYISDGGITNPNGYNVELEPAKLPKCEHTLIEVASKDATCTKQGNVNYWQCSLCNEYYGDKNATSQVYLKDIVLKANGHSEVVDDTVEPSYSTTGLTEGRHCSTCGAILVEQKLIPTLETLYHSITYKNTKTAIYPSETSYAEHVGLLDMPQIAVDGYKFIGWYTASLGGSLVDYIPEGSTQNYVLFAHWELETYTITYDLAPINNNPKEYTIETETFRIEDPFWSGLSFAYWTDETGNLITKITKGSTGNITLTAHWKYYENIAIPSKNKSMLTSVYDETLGIYHFIFKAGIIDNVVLKEYESFDKKVGESLSWSKTEEFSVENSIASNVANTVSRNISTSKEWSQTSEMAQSNSKCKNWSLSAGLGLDFEKIRGSIEATNGGSITDENTWTNTTLTGTAVSSDSKNDNTFSSTVSWVNNTSLSMTRTLNLSESMTAGTYTLACIGKVAVYVIASYNPALESYHLDTYSELENNFRTATLYKLPSDSKVRIVENQPLSYGISMDELQTYINSSWYKVQYDANGGDGEMPTSIFYSGINQPICANSFIREGYTFLGWNYQTDASVIFYQDKQRVCDIANPGETIILKAIWTANQYTVTFDVVGGNALSYSTHSVTYNERYSKHGTLPVPTRTGYTFDGWYNGNNFVFDDSIVVTSANHILTAKWVPVIYTVIFDANGGTTLCSTKQVEYESIYGELPIATKTGYVFNGWYTLLFGGEQVLPESATISSGEPQPTTLYAHWEPIKYILDIYVWDCSERNTLFYDQSYTLSWSDLASRFLYGDKWEFYGWYYCAGFETLYNDDFSPSNFISTSPTYVVKNLTTEQGATINIAAKCAQKKACFTGDTLVNLSDGSSARLDSLKANDIVMSWNPITGELEAKPISLLWNHGESIYDVISCTFSNKKTLKVVNEHGFFDATLNKYVFINALNYNMFVGHEFACLNKDGVLENVKMISVDCKKTIASCYSLQTACNANAIVDGFLTLTHEDIPGFLTYFEFGYGYMYDKQKMAEDIEKYGLYTYDDWKEYGTYEEFVALNGKYLTIIIGKGYCSYEDVLELIAQMRQIQSI